MELSWIYRILLGIRTYGSRANDQVHDYLEDHPGYGVRQRWRRSCLNWGRGVVSYYENNNLLVGVNGSDGTLPALLLSAHYDSVPSSFGVTDDGMGVASLLGVLRFVATTSRDEQLSLTLTTMKSLDYLVPMRLSNTPGLNRLATF